MRNCGFGICTICGAPYQKQTANAQVCGDVCRNERDNRRKRISKGPLTKPKMNECVICGKQFMGRLPNYPYKCCGNPDCRREIRRLGGKQAAKTVAAKRKGVMATCLKCDKSFKAPHPFIRICPECKRNQGIHETYSTVWGNAI